MFYIANLSRVKESEIRDIIRVCGKLAFDMLDKEFINKTLKKRDPAQIQNGLEA